MMKTIKLICCGIIPMVVGFLFDRIIILLPIPHLLSMMLAIVLLFLWGYFAYKISTPERNSILQAFLMCGFGLIMLALVLYQELVLGSYFGNISGFATQVFFLPYLSIASAVVSPFMKVIRIWPMYIVIWVAMFIISYIGFSAKKRG